jgi:hypothetical protein
LQGKSVVGIGSLARECVAIVSVVCSVVVSVLTKCTRHVWQQLAVRHGIAIVAAGREGCEVVWVGWHVRLCIIG